MSGRRLSYWIGEALRARRENAGVPPGTIASILNMNERKIARIEGDEGEEAQSYQGIDRVVAAYAYMLGVSDPRVLWIDALELWFGDGEIPDFLADLPGAAFVRPLREENRQRQHPQAEPEDRLGALRRKKRGGQ